MATLSFVLRQAVIRQSAFIKPNVFQNPIRFRSSSKDSCKQVVHRSHGYPGGVPGANLPFGKSIGRPWKMTFLFIVFFGSGTWATSLLFMFLMLK